MKSRKNFFIGLFAFIFFFGAASLASAAGFTYTPLENIPGAEGATTFPEYVSGLYKFAIWSVGIAAMFMLTLGGFMYMTSAGNTDALGRAKGVIKDSIIGLVLALFAWFILNIINPDLVNVNLSKFSEVGGTVPPANQQVQSVVNGTNALPVWAATCTKPTPTQNNATIDCTNRNSSNPANTATYGSISNSSAQSVLNSAGNLDDSGFTLSSSGNCWDGTCTNCTSLNQIPRYAIQNLKDLRTKSGCGDLVITGGTEYGHTTHCPLAPSIDIRNRADNPGGVCLGNYLKSIKASVGNNQARYVRKLHEDFHIDFICTDPAWISVMGNCTPGFLEEVGHFHISFCGFVHRNGTVQC